MLVKNKSVYSSHTLRTEGEGKSGNNRFQIMNLIAYISLFAAAAAAKSLQSCPTLYDPTDGSPPGFPVPGTGNPVKVAGLWCFEIVVMKSTGKS